MRRRRFLALALSSVLAIAGCRNHQQAGQPGASQTAAARTPATTSETSGGATPTASYELIPVWAMHQVPKYPGTEPGELSPLATQVQNGGTISFATPDPADKVLDFYRTALQQLGWALQPSPKSSVAAKRGDAALTVIVKGGEQGTTVLLMLTDAV